MTGTQARKLRKRLGFAQADLARELGISSMTIRNRESEQRVPKQYEYALRFLDVRMAAQRLVIAVG